MMERVDIWTDGSVVNGSRGRGGWAAILLARSSARIIGGFHKSTTNNRMETTALLEALKRLKHPCDVHLFTDSMYLIYGLQRIFMGKDLLDTNRDLWEELERRLQQYPQQITVSKVKAHTGIKYNEMVDVYASSCGESQMQVDEWIPDIRSLKKQKVVSV